MIQLKTIRKTTGQYGDVSLSDDEYNGLINASAGNYYTFISKNISGKKAYFYKIRADGTDEPLNQVHVFINYIKEINDA